MANLHINQFNARANHNNGSQQLALLRTPPAGQQNVTFSSSTQSAAAAAETQFWQVVADADCFIEVGDNPTAAVTSTPLTAGQFFEFQISVSHKVAVLEK